MSVCNGWKITKYLNWQQLCFCREGKCTTKLQQIRIVIPVLLIGEAELQILCICRSRTGNEGYAYWERLCREIDFFLELQRVVLHFRTEQDGHISAPVAGWAKMLSSVWWRNWVSEQLCYLKTEKVSKMIWRLYVVRVSRQGGKSNLGNLKIILWWGHGGADRSSRRENKVVYSMADDSNKVKNIVLNKIPTPNEGSYSEVHVKLFIYLFMM